jgi:hypothetical protein
LTAFDYNKNIQAKAWIHLSSYDNSSASYAITRSCFIMTIEEHFKENSK